MNKGKIYHINFDGYKGSEINNIHLGIVFNIPKINNMVFCIPLTSPKLKHFKTETTEVLKDNIRENLDDLEFSDDFFDKTSKM